MLVLIPCAVWHIQSVFGMNFFDFGEKTRRITVAKDIYIFVAFWLGLTALTAATFFWAYMRGRRRLKRMEEAAFEAIKQDSAKPAIVPLSSTSGFAGLGRAKQPIQQSW